MHYRVTWITILSSFGVGLIGVHYFARLWPILPVAIAFGAGALVLASRRFGPSAAWLLGACGLLFAHTSIALLYPETLSVIDPDTYAVWVNQVINSGSITQAETRTYSTLPVFLLVLSLVSEVTDLVPRSAFVTIPILVSIIVPLVTAWFTAVLTGCSHREWPAVPAALLAPILTMTVVSGYRPIAMTVSYLLMFLALVASIRFLLWRNKADVIAFVVLGFGVTISHRFTILLLALGVATQGAVLAAVNFPDRIRADFIVLPFIGVILLVLQWLYITTSLSITVYQLVNIFTETGVQIGVDEIGTSASRPAIDTRLLGIVARRGHGIVLISIAGVSWLYFAGIEFTRMRSRVVVSLATAAVLAAFLPLSIAFPDQLNYTRTVTIAEPVLLGLAIACGWSLWRNLDARSGVVMQSGRAILLLFGVLLIVAQVGSAPISADHPASHRGYLDGDEASAKMWGHQYAGTNISADPFFAHERPLPAAYVDSDGRIKEAYRQRYRLMLEPYTDQSIAEACPTAVMYRQVRIYRSPRSQVLQWDPESTLNTEYTRHYDAGGIQFYTDPRCR